MIYLHRDSIYENQTIGSWAIPIFKYLRKKGKQVKLIDAHDLEVVNNLTALPASPNLPAAFIFGINQ